ncbi:anti-sigma factor [Cohnella nanjingensis]|uniref:Anti-sigma-W factor RsiW n=1 Tax=Cohnella nanjingensis TaxID=1387779 RepID=A0A7X0RRQ1_9BACL|nr:anti-sigma factor [Cohnella nanjingensis]MBB6672464.1 anti-sigma factor [Cohnella nanjingensis]
MDQRKETPPCEGLVDYMLGEGTDLARKRFEHHLSECASCRADAAAWSDTWNGLYRDMELMDPPEDLKFQVMASLDAPAAPVAPPTAPVAPPAVQPYSASPVRRRFGRRLAAAALLLLAVSAGWWGRDILHSLRSEQSQAQISPDRIESVFHLAADRSAGRLTDYPRAYGLACVVDTSERSKQLIVYLFGAPETEGSEAYQVWLWNDGARTSAGSMKVASSGIGILTLPLGEDTPRIQAIGVTLEPDGPATAPQGPKVFGSSSEDPEWRI